VCILIQILKNYVDNALVTKPTTRAPFAFQINNSKIEKILELETKQFFQNTHTVIRNASFSRRHIIKENILKLDIPLNSALKPSYLYSVDDIAFGITTSVDRLFESIRNFHFWIHYPGVRCLVLFYRSAIHSYRGISELFASQSIPCEIHFTNTSRYEERFLDLVTKTWNLFGEARAGEYKKPIKWLAISDDDTLWFIPNLLRVLNEYDSSHFIYLGDHSDNPVKTSIFGTYYAYGGGGFLVSRPIAQNLTKNISHCDAYRNSYGGDIILGKCITQRLKVNLSRSDKFHQMDIHGDATGIFESGIQGLVSVHHMFSWWMPVPDWVATDRFEIVNRFRKAYQSTSFSYLKRYIWIDWAVNQTLVLTLGYSITIYNKSLSEDEINAVENTFCCASLFRRTRKATVARKTWYFKDSNFNFSSGHCLVHIFMRTPNQVLINLI
jgi:hypothetical protein